MKKNVTKEATNTPKRRNTVRQTEYSEEESDFVLEGETSPKKGMSKWKRLKILLGVIALLVLVGAVAWYIQSQNTPEKKIEKVNEQLKEHMILPEEEPAVFTIEDPNLLVSEQQFFQNAEKGDVLLVYQAAQKAVIFSPDRDIIVNVGPVTFDATTTGGTAIQQ